MAVVRFLRSDGLVIGTRPETSRVGASAGVTLGRALSLLATSDFTRDESVRDLRVLSGVTYRFGN